MILKPFFAVAFSAGLFATIAQAAVLTGDTVTVNLTADVDYGDQVVAVGPGSDASYFSNQFADLDAGANNDLLTLSSAGSFTSIDGVGGAPVVWTFTDLDFDDGSLLTGFAILQSFSNAVAVTTSNSVTITYDDTAITNGTYFTGRFLTESSQVPLPAALPLLGAGLAGLALVGRRRRG